MSHNRGGLVASCSVVGRPLTVRWGAHGACGSMRPLVTTLMPHNIQLILRNPIKLVIVIGLIMLEHHLAGVELRLHWYLATVPVILALSVGVGAPGLDC